MKGNKGKNGMMMIVMLIIVVIGIVYAWQGIAMHRQVLVEETRFHDLQADYFIQSKAVRDGAPTGSELNQQLVTIQNFPSQLLTLKLLGVGNILAGIFVLLFGILLALVMMPVRLGKILKGGDEKPA